MSTWTDIAQQVAARSFAAAGIEQGDVTAPPKVVVGTFSPEAQVRKLLHGLVPVEEMDDAVKSCFGVACNEQRMMQFVGTPEGQIGSMMSIVAQVFAHGILYGRQCAEA